MAKQTVTIPAELIPKFEAWGKLTAQIFGELRRKKGIVPEGVPEDQKWFWTSEWQAMEREADEAEARGDYIEFENEDEAIKYLQSL